MRDGSTAGRGLLSDAETDAAVAADGTWASGRSRPRALVPHPRRLGPEAFPSTAVARVVYARLRRDGVGGVPLADWLAARRRTAAIRWHWQAGATHGAGDEPVRFVFR